MEASRLNTIAVYDYRRRRKPTGLDHYVLNGARLNGFDLSAISCGSLLLEIPSWFVLRSVTQISQALISLIAAWSRPILSERT